MPTQLILIQPSSETLCDQSSSHLTSLSLASVRIDRNQLGGGANLAWLWGGVATIREPGFCPALQHAQPPIRWMEPERRSQKRTSEVMRGDEGKKASGSGKRRFWLAKPLLFLERWGCSFFLNMIG